MCSLKTRVALEQNQKSEKQNFFCSTILYCRTMAICHVFGNMRMFSFRLILLLKKKLEFKGEKLLLDLAYNNIKPLHLTYV